MKRPRLIPQRLVTRRRLKWVALGAASVLLVVSCVSLWYGLVLERFGRSDVTQVAVVNGCVSFFWKDYPARFPGFRVRHGAPIRFHIQAWFDWEVQQYGGPKGVSLDVLHVVIPLWVPFLLLSVLTVWLWRTDRVPPGHCPHCRYDLRGIRGSVCPECGGSWRMPCPPASPPPAPSPPGRGLG